MVYSKVWHTLQSINLMRTRGNGTGALQYEANEQYIVSDYDHYLRNRYGVEGAAFVTVLSGFPFYKLIILNKQGLS